MFEVFLIQKEFNLNYRTFLEYIKNDNFNGPQNIILQFIMEGFEVVLLDTLHF